MWAQRWIAAATIACALLAVKFGFGLFAPKAAGNAVAAQTGVVHGKLPAGYPGDVPLYRPSRVVASYSSPQPGLSNRTLMMKAEADADSILAYYRRELPPQGWTVEEAGVTAAGDIKGLSATQGARRLHITVQQGPYRAGSTLTQSLLEPN